jgi:hypothetical protein
VRLLIDGQDRFQAEATDVLRAGLADAAWVTVDNTGARHKAQNGFCTQIGNDRFAWFGTTGSAVSRRRIHLFVAKVAITALFGVGFVVLPGFPLLRSMALLYSWQSLFAAVIALFQRQRVDATILTGIG